MSVFTDPNQLLLVANVAYSFAVAIVGGVTGYALGKRVGSEEGERIGRLISQKRKEDR